MITMKKYEATILGKQLFVEEVLSPLLYSANTGYLGAEYEEDNGKEFVYLLNDLGGVLGLCRVKKINVTADSLEAIVRDVFKNL